MKNGLLNTLRVAVGALLLFAAVYGYRNHIAAALFNARGNEVELRLRTHNSVLVRPGVLLQLVAEQQTRSRRLSNARV